MYVLKIANGQNTVFNQRLIVFHFPTKNLNQIGNFFCYLIGHPAVAKDHIKYGLFLHPFICPNIFSKLDH